MKIAVALLSCSMDLRNGTYSIVPSEKKRHISIERCILGIWHFCLMPYLSILWHAFLDLMHQLQRPDASRTTRFFGSLGVLVLHPLTEGWAGLLRGKSADCRPWLNSWITYRCFSSFEYLIVPDLTYVPILHLHFDCDRVYWWSMLWVWYNFWSALRCHPHVVEWLFVVRINRYMLAGSCLHQCCGIFSFWHRLQ